MGKRKQETWKPVPITGNFSNEDFEGLAFIEELQGYNVDSNEVVCLDSFSRGEKHHEGDSVSSSKKLKISASGGDLWSVSPLESTRVHEYPSKTKHSKSDKCSNQKPQKKAISNDSGVVKMQSKDLPFSGSFESNSTIPSGMEAWSEFSLPPCILQALCQLGFKSPTEIQAQTLHASVHGKKDILGAAETGSGKTLAFGIPIIQGILHQKQKIRNTPKKKFHEKTSALVDNENTIKDACEGTREKVSECGKKLFALVLTPTRELAIQVRNHLAAVAKFAGIKVEVVVGGLALQKQERLLNRRPEIVVATPGRLWEMIQSRNQHLQQIADISFLAIDETDRMLEKGHFQELKILLNYMNRNEYKKQQRQNFVFSATLTMVHEPPTYLRKGKRITPGQKLHAIIASLGITQPKIVDITQEKGTASTLTEARIVCNVNEKDFYIYYLLLRQVGRTLVFCNSISCVRRLTQLLDVLQCKPYPLHAKMQQRQRLKNLERFRDNQNGLLLATDVAARGLDIPDVQYVIHYQVPRTTENYVHRSGRTARAKKEGSTILLMEPDEVSSYVNLCRTLGRDHDLPEFPIDNSLLGAAKARVSLARQIEHLEHTSRKNASQTGWFNKAVREMDLLVDEDEMPKSFDDEDTADIKRKIKGLKKQLLHLIDNPILSKGVSFKYPSLSGAGLKGTTIPTAVEKKKKNRGIHIKIYR